MGLEEAAGGAHRRTRSRRGWTISGGGVRCERAGASEGEKVVVGGGGRERYGFMGFFGIDGEGRERGAGQKE